VQLFDAFAASPARVYALSLPAFAALFVCMALAGVLSEAENALVYNRLEGICGGIGLVLAIGWLIGEWGMDGDGPQGVFACCSPRRWVPDPGSIARRAVAMLANHAAVQRMRVQLRAISTGLVSPGWCSSSCSQCACALSADMAAAAERT